MRCTPTPSQSGSARTTAAERGGAAETRFPGKRCARQRGGRKKPGRNEVGHNMSNGEAAGAELPAPQAQKKTLAHVLSVDQRQVPDADSGSALKGLPRMESTSSVDFDDFSLEGLSSRPATTAYRHTAHGLQKQELARTDSAAIREQPLPDRSSSADEDVESSPRESGVSAQRGPRSKPHHKRMLSERLRVITFTGDGSAGRHHHADLDQLERGRVSANPEDSCFSTIRTFIFYR